MKKLLLFVVVALLGVWPMLLQADSTPKTEKDYELAWCPKIGGQNTGPTTVIREPLNRKLVGYADCVTEAYVIEIDFGKKFKECIGQALTYMTFSGRRGACALITDIHSKYYRQAEAVIETNGLSIDLLLISP